MTPYFRRLAAAAAAGAAVVALAGAGAATARTTVAPPRQTHNVTPSCTTCFSLTTLASFAEDMTQQAYIPGTNGHAVPSQGRVGQKIVFRFGDNTNSNMDFRASVGDVSDFCVTDPPPTSQQFNETGYICNNYRGDNVYESEWAPLGVGSGLCVGVAVANRDQQNVTLQRCGETTRTLWIADQDNARDSHTPWINGSDTNFSHPLVLAVHNNSTRPINQLFVERENLLNIGFVANNEMFRVHFGPWV